MSDTGLMSLEGRLLLLAPTVRDATTSCDVLSNAGFRCCICHSIDDVCREAKKGAGAALVTAEAILRDNEGRLAQLLKEQPPWSDLPLMVLTQPGPDSPRILAALTAIGHMTLIKRPLQVSILVSAVGSALRDRRRQYAVRDLLEERRAAEEVLREERERYQVTLGSIGDGVIATDTSGRVTFLNSVAEHLTGWDAGALGRPLEEVFRIIDETTRRPLPNPALRALQNGAVIGLPSNTLLLSRDGLERPLDDSAAPIRGTAGEAVGAVLVFRDITERKKAEEAAKEADRRKDDFIALLAHELRNPLAPIRNGLQVMRLAGNNTSAISQARAMMDRQLGHMVRLIDDLLDISRISRNKMELRRTRVLLADVVSNAVETARPVIEAAGHELTVELPTEPIFLDADLTRLAQVFSNLLTNSAKYTERGGRIWLNAESHDSAITVSVRDTGIGIPATALPNIFDMFSQIDRPMERSTGGLGIGLALVKGLVEMHGGSVSASSDGQGTGSTFTVTLSVAEVQAEPLAPVPAEGIVESGPQRRMLVVDDNQDSANSMAMMLRLLGNNVNIAYDGIEALEAAERFRPDYILMDIGMSKLNGLEATRRIRQQSWGRAINIIALTGRGQDNDRVQSQEAGCDGHLVKPVNLMDLDRILTELPAENSSRA